MAVEEGRNQVKNRMSVDRGGANETIGNAAPTGNVASDALGSSPPAGTSAAIYGTVFANGAVHVRANDKLTVFGVAGAAAGGFVGIGVAGVLPERQRPAGPRRRRHPQ